MSVRKCRSSGTRREEQNDCEAAAGKEITSPVETEQQQNYRIQELVL